MPIENEEHSLFEEFDHLPEINDVDFDEYVDPDGEEMFFDDDDYYDPY